jgi:hypothetical protein
MTFFDILICAIFIIFVAFIFINQVVLTNKSATLLVQSSRDKFYYSLDQRKTISIKGEIGYTIIEIDKGKFHFKDSPCKNKICVHAGIISLPNYPVICLPNKVSAYMTSKPENAEFDGVTQ